MARPFYLGLNMSGTVSAGAYTAGVMDFLIEAMDAWYAERQRNLRQFGQNYDQWTIPPHELELAVMAGASGGGITAALTAAALSQDFSHIRDQPPLPGARVNNLFQSWVADIDLRRLAGHVDLDTSNDKLVSLLDSTPIHTIASKAFLIMSPLADRRAWVRDGLKVILTLTNLGGVPYAVEPQSDADSARTLYYADRQQFEVLWNEAPSGGVTHALNATGGSAWRKLADAAVATSAFPVVLAPQFLNRTAGEYNGRRWRIPQDDSKRDSDGACKCETNDPMPPTWALPDDAPVMTLNVDGGATNNSPFDCARLELASLEPPVAGGHNPRDPMLADRVVINVAPLFTEVKPGPPPIPSTDLLSLFSGLVSAVVNQSRIQGENLRLGADPNVASRWVIAPTSEQRGVEPLAGALLNAFGAFVAQTFREHDYQLGRRNCQRFLTAYFGLPWDNELMRSYGVSAATQSRLNGVYGMPSPTDPQATYFPLVPVLPSLRPEIAVVRKPITQAQLEDMADLVLDRLKRVAKALIEDNGGGGFSEFAFNGAWLFLKGRLREKLLVYAARELASQGFVH